MHGCRHAVRLYALRASQCHVLVSPDLGFLLGRCSRLALREGDQPVILEAELLIQWRTLQVVTATPFLPGLNRLSCIFPGVHLDSAGFQVPLLSQSPEEVLVECLTHGIPVAGSRIVYTVPPTNGRMSRSWVEAEHDAKTRPRSVLG
jgi:hypothetical protein